MNRTILAVALVAFNLAEIPTASAWHLSSKRACLREAFAPHCGAGTVATCASRRSCMVEPHRTIQACAEWRCRPKD